MGSGITYYLDAGLPAPQAAQVAELESRINALNDEITSAIAEASNQIGSTKDTAMCHIRDLRITRDGLAEQLQNLIVTASTSPSPQAPPQTPSDPAQTPQTLLPRR